jgi:hypothetical protein
MYLALLSLQFALLSCTMLVHFYNIKKKTATTSDGKELASLPFLLLYNGIFQHFTEFQFSARLTFCDGMREM